MSSSSMPTVTIESLEVRRLLSWSAYAKLVAQDLAANDFSNITGKGVTVAEIDTGKCPLYLLTGEYDLSATPALTAELAKLVKATHFEVMKGLGHFPMSESPEQFRHYLLPVLDRIAG